ncbi:hypothetical protein [Solimonas terrae]|uniref:Uncharacterized protein n=1 Tax=Solimonas terrae TaxID=1396819 RepID=A0A6M2BNS8_9GAMM|nr:hypothetical protein [Solimonas terrae]NGY03683.1 hypothetical protein [Solimonas terrae]
MRKIFALIAVLLIVAAGGWWYHVRGAADRFDYEAVFEKPATSGAAASLIDIVAIAGKPRAAVSKVLGEPQRCEPGEFSERCRYNGIGVEITYIADKADWITVPLSSGELPLAATSLAVLGLPQREPDQIDEHDDIWHGLAGYREVRLVGNDQGAIYARIKVTTL